MRNATSSSWHRPAVFFVWTRHLASIYHTNTGHPRFVSVCKFSARLSHRDGLGDKRFALCSETAFLLQHRCVSENCSLWPSCWVLFKKKEGAANWQHIGLMTTRMRVRHQCGWAFFSPKSSMCQSNCVTCACSIIFFFSSKKVFFALALGSMSLVRMVGSSILSAAASRQRHGSVGWSPASDEKMSKS